MRKSKLKKENLAILLILIISAILNFANIGIEGYANQYYAAGVKSMLMSFKNFFFVSFDPAGFVTIDKPPVGFWIQTISAKIFGFSGWSILLPQALAGVISVWLIYYLVRRSFGTFAGLVSALCLTVTPVFVAASRSNTIDNLLVMTLLFGCWALFIATEKGEFKYLIISLVLVGIGFNIKMLQAYMILPALYITYLLSTVVNFKKRIVHLVVGTFVLITVSLSWAVAVDLVPAENRPFIGSSTNNTVKELIFGHNGLERLVGGSRGGSSQKDDGNRGTELATPPGNGIQDQGRTRNYQSTADANSGATQLANNGVQGQGRMNHQDGTMQPPNDGSQHGPRGKGGLQGSFGGETPAGITRLFSKNILSDQIVWFLPLALLGFVAASIKEKLKLSLDNRRKLSLILWIVWLLPEFIYFSFTKGLFHPYYLTMMAAPIAALSGIGMTSAWEMYKEGGWKSWVLPAELIASALTEALMLSYFNNISNTFRYLILISLVLSFASIAILAMLNVVKNRKFISESNKGDMKESEFINTVTIYNSLQNNASNNINKVTKVLASIAFIGLLSAPVIGASAPITHNLSDTTPSAGLELLSGSEREDFRGAGFNNNSSNRKLVEFLQSNKTTEKYLLVVSSSQQADSIIINTGESVMALGGFSGSDKILTLDQFKEMVNKKEVRYVMLGGMGGRGSGSEIMNWVKENGKIVSESKWKDSTQIESSRKGSSLENKESGRFDGGNSQQLYDLKK